jgi:hypothetical protein
MGGADRRWITQALAHWRIVEREMLHLDRAPLPTIVAVDACCTYIARSRGGDALVWAGRSHGGTVRFPDGKTAPVRPISFASADSGAAAPGYFAMSLPSVWRAAGVRSGLGLERLMGRVLLHEMMHTRQFLLRQRRARWFTGEVAKWAPLDDLFLDMEGLGQWAAYAWYVDPRGLDLGAARAQTEVRRDGKHWTQDEGLALFLTIDRLVPDWQSLAFGRTPALAEELLQAAAMAPAAGEHRR